MVATYLPRRLGRQIVRIMDKTKMASIRSVGSF